MAVTTTGSTVIGLVPGMHKGLVGASIIGGGSSFAPGDEIMYTTGNPDGIVTSAVVSGVAYDVNNMELYMGAVTGGSKWIHLGSVA